MKICSLFFYAKYQQQVKPHPDQPRDKPAEMYFGVRNIYYSEVSADCCHAALIVVLKFILVVFVAIQLAQ